MKYPALIFLVAIGLRAQTGMGTTPTTGSGGQTSVQANRRNGVGRSARVPFIFPAKSPWRTARAVRRITIERVCSGIAKTVAYTDSNGRFNFQWGDRSMIVTDASDAGSGLPGIPTPADSAVRNPPAAPTPWRAIHSGTA